MSKTKLFFYLLTIVFMLFFITPLIRSFINNKYILLSIQDLVKNINLKYVVICIIVTISYMLISSISSSIVMAKYSPISFKDCMFIGMSEFFFNNITPFSYGSQPFQVYQMNMVKNFDLKKRTSIVLINFFIQSLTITVIGYVFFCIYGFNLSSKIELKFKFLLLVGFFVNLLVAFLTICIGCSRSATKIIHSILLILVKLPLLNLLRKWVENHFLKFADDTREIFTIILSNKKVFFLSFILKIISMLLYYSLLFFSIKCFYDISYIYLPYFICVSCLILTMVLFIPTPGSVGTTETSFKFLMQQILVGFNLPTIGIFWRLFNFILVTFLSLICFVTFVIYINVRNKKKTK